MNNFEIIIATESGFLAHDHKDLNLHFCFWRAAFYQLNYDRV